MASKAAISVKLFGRHVAAAGNSANNMHRLSLIRNSTTTALMNSSSHSISRNLTKTQGIYQYRCFSTEKPQQQNADDGATTNVGSLQDSEENKKLLAEVERLTKELTAEKEKGNELLDKYRRSLAESENMRVRLNKQISDAKIFGIQSFCKDLLEVADTLGHATLAVPKDKLAENADLKNLYEGLTMTRASLLQVFKRHGLEPLDPINQKFDPNFHEALFQKEDNSVEPNTVVEVTKLGYKLQERCIRPALVGVSKG